MCGLMVAARVASVPDTDIRLDMSLDQRLTIIVEHEEIAAMLGQPGEQLI
jgi:hypothetical protein